jgi:hypothetical protein
VTSQAKALVNDLSDATRTAVADARRRAVKVRYAKIARDLFHAYLPERFPGFEWLTQELNARRDALFHHIVRIIRISQREELEALAIQAETFCFGLQMAKDAGCEKAGRFLRPLELMCRPLRAVCDDDYFRRFVEDLAHERSRDSSRVSDVLVLREMTKQVGLAEAETIHAFHAQIPAALETLKRSIVWKRA